VLKISEVSTKASHGFFSEKQSSGRADFSRVKLTRAQIRYAIPEAIHMDYLPYDIARCGIAGRLRNIKLHVIENLLSRYRRVESPRELRCKWRKNITRMKSSAHLSPKHLRARCVKNPCVGRVCID